MSLTKLTENLNNVSSLPDKPSLQTEELKAEFDKAGNSIKEYINSTLTEEIDNSVTDLTNEISTNKSNISENAKNIETANENINKKAPTHHGSSANTYGLGANNYYGHCKLVNDCNASAYEQGAALSAYQGKVLKNELEELEDEVRHNSAEINDLTEECIEIKEDIANIMKKIDEIISRMS